MLSLAASVAKAVFFISDHLSKPALGLQPSGRLSIISYLYPMILRIWLRLNITSLTCPLTDGLSFNRMSNAESLAFDITVTSSTASSGR